MLLYARRGEAVYAVERGRGNGEWGTKPSFRAVGNPDGGDGGGR